MKIAILGTGMVGQAIGSKLVALGHEVRMGSRTAGNEKAAAWVEQAGKGASAGTFADAAAFGELVFNCTAGVASLQALEAAGADNLADKILLDLSNPGALLTFLDLDGDGTFGPSLNPLENDVMLPAEFPYLAPPHEM